MRGVEGQVANRCTAEHEPLATYETGDRDGLAMLLVSGEVDLATVLTFRHALAELIAAAHSPAVVDLSRVTFIDATGLSALIAARAAVAGTDVRLVLLDPSPSVRRLFEVVGLEHRFDTASSEGGRR